MGVCTSKYKASRILHFLSKSLVEQGVRCEAQSLVFERGVSGGKEVPSVRTYAYRRPLSPVAERQERDDRERQLQALEHIQPRAHTVRRPDVTPHQNGHRKRGCLLYTSPSPRDS